MFAPPVLEVPPTAIAWLWRDAPVPAWSQTVAVVDRHIWLAGDKVLVRPGAQPRRLPVRTAVVPVVHVEIDPIRPPRTLQHAQAVVLAAMRSAARASTSGWVQLDLEARPSHRADYRMLVQQVRTALPAGIKLSVTALAWWCRSPNWLDDLPVDEVVPMFFRMGRDNVALRGIVADQPQLLHPACRATAAGFSRQEPYTQDVTRRYRRTYWFDEKGWQQK
ncbi:hypothetical protein IP92_01269 [Pseudoduganella flava]|uniref:DUF3142 domain-containing protein n=1 Tax=Pseudoduganella flava TaxID=871742 RepID=A0A562Q030_9BURK|nr:hypothetical protein [Pseudoduganella flava]QGZ38409.1 hypothetical protein GO485_04645 [Pseudoduganella flava]TWI50045.1 hypothetical protein IP92_01269 [Pseudoduganella flava]